MERLRSAPGHGKILTAEILRAEKRLVGASRGPLGHLVAGRSVL